MADLRRKNISRMLVDLDAGLIADPDDVEEAIARFDEELPAERRRYLEALEAFLAADDQAGH